MEPGGHHQPDVGCQGQKDHKGKQQKVVDLQRLFIDGPGVEKRQQNDADWQQPQDRRGDQEEKEPVEQRRSASQEFGLGAVCRYLHADVQKRSG